MFSNCKKSVKQNTNNVAKDEYYTIKQSEILQNKNLPALINKLQNEDLQVKSSKEKIPSFISDYLEAFDNDFKIANPEENWTATDVTFDKNLAKRKLIYFAQGKQISLLSYYKGGIGKSICILIFENNGDNVTDFWCGHLNREMTNKDEIIDYLQKNINKNFVLNTNIITF